MSLDTRGIRQRKQISLSNSVDCLDKSRTAEEEPSVSDVGAEAPVSLISNVKAWASMNR